jgi:hypothetical protein
MHGARRDMIFAAGRGGLLARWDGGAWRRMEPPCSDDLIAVHAAADDDVWAIAKPGTLLHGTTLGLRPVLTTDRKLRAVVRYQGAVYVGIEDEGLFRFANGALLQAFDEVGIEVVAALVTLEAKIREHVAAELAVHAIDLDVDVGASWAAGHHRT